MQNSNLKNCNKQIPMECPQIFADILVNLHNLIPNIDLKIKGNNVITKMAQMLSSKRLKVKVGRRENYINWFAINLSESGMGKDLLIDTIDEFVLPKFHEWYRNKMDELGLEIESEINNATMEGIYEYAKKLEPYNIGSAFVKMPEFGLDLYKGGSAKQQLINNLNEMFNGKIPNKVTKTQGYSKPITNVPTVFMAHTAPVLINSDNNQVFDKILRSGLCRRLILTCQSETRLTEVLLSDEEENAIIDDLINLGEQLFELFNSIEIGATYIMQEDARVLLNNYSLKNIQLYNKERNPLLKIELHSRTFKVVKLAGIFACLNHATDYIINAIDVKQAIELIEYLSQDFYSFYYTEPNKSDKYQKAFDILLKYKNRWMSKCELMDKLIPLGFSREKIRKNMRSSLALINDIACENGYQIVFNHLFFKNGIAYALVKAEYPFINFCAVGKIYHIDISNDG